MIGKQCKTCKLFLEESQFGRTTAYKDGCQRNCRKCVSEKAKQKRKDKPEEHQGYQLRYLYGIGIEEYKALMEEQGGVCAICGNPPKEGKTLAVDHDHACCPRTKTCGNCRRGLLCQDCNLMIGHAREEKERLLKAVNYLEMWEV